METHKNESLKLEKSRVKNLLGSSKLLLVLSVSSALLFLLFGVLSVYKFPPRLAIVGLLLALLGISESLFLAPFVLRNIRKSIGKIENALRRLSKGEFVEMETIESVDLQESSNYFSGLQHSMQQASQFSYHIGKGNFEVDLVSAGEQDVLNNSLLTMRDQLKNVAEEDGKRSWVTNGIAQLGEILRSHESATDFYDSITTFVVKYTESNQGGLFLVQKDENGSYLELVSMYAYETKKFLKKRIEIGEGLAGRAYLERDAIFLTEVPNDYMHITSGLGSANPKSIFIIPLMINEEVQGVLELASFQRYPNHYMDFVKRSAESVASVISNMRIAERTSLLLKQSQEQTEMLRAQEEEVRQNLEEMTATQEELARKTKEIEEASIESKCILHAIDTTMATIEFTPEGRVLRANKNFLNVMRCAIEDIQGKHHREFVPNEIIESKEYHSFWSDLAMGKALKGVFKRRDRQGRTVWLNAIYNPILNTEGKVTKVVKFATDVTLEQEMIAENKGVLAGIDATMATIEFSPDGIIRDANTQFLQTMGYSLVQIKGKHHRMFVPKEEVETQEYQLFWSKLADGKPLTGTFQRIGSNGEPVWLNAIYNPIFNASGEVVKVVKFATDVTSEKMKEVKLQQFLEETRAQEEELRQNMEEMTATQEEMNKVMLEMQAQNSIINSIAIVSKADLQGNITYVNDEFVKWSQYSKKELIGQNHRILKSGHQDDALFQDLWKTISAGKIWRGEVKNRAKDGSYYWVDAIIAPIMGPDGKPKEYIAQRFVINDKSKG